MEINVNSRLILRAFSVLVLLLFIGSYQAAAQSKVPEGSYKKTCKNFHVLGDFLTAYCENEKGDWVNTKINMSFCEGDIRNENGTLKCKQRPAPKPPAGSYTDSCKDIRVAGNQLRANCQKRNGKWKQASINYKKCSRDIWNNNGELSCSNKDSASMPKGSYKDSCRDYYTEGNRLYAKCQRKSGGWEATSINYKKCGKSISNDNGQLICGKAGGGKLPPGSYKDSCRNIYKEGNLLEAECKNKNGKWKHTSIKFKNCNKGLWNDNGKLRCN